MNHEQTTSAYLQRLGRCLRGLPVSERESVLREIESHIEQRIARGASAQDVISGLGSPDALARAYVDQEELYRALGRPSPTGVIGALLNRATTSAANLIIALAGVCLFAFALSFLLIAIAKMVAPEHVGYWRTSAGVELGIIAVPPAAVPEQLGIWIIPIGLVASVLCYVVGNALVRRRAKWLARHTRVLDQS